jgi:hypothetical protein
MFPLRIKSVWTAIAGGKLLQNDSSCGTVDRGTACTKKSGSLSALIKLFTGMGEGKKIVQNNPFMGMT